MTGAEFDALPMSEHELITMIVDIACMLQDLDEIEAQKKDAKKEIEAVK